jgi:hypothetical protein
MDCRPALRDRRRETACSSHDGIPSRRGGLGDQFSEPESLVEFVYQDQAAVGSNAGTLQINLERGAEGELKGLISYLTH